MPGMMGGSLPHKRMKVMDLTEEERRVIEMWRVFKGMVEREEIPKLSMLKLYPDTSGDVNSAEVIERNEEEKTTKIRHVRHAICYNGHVWPEHIYYEYVRPRGWIHPRREGEVNE